MPREPSTALAPSSRPGNHRSDSLYLATRNFHSSRSFKPPRPLPLGFLQLPATRTFHSSRSFSHIGHYRSDFFNPTPCGTSTVLAPSSRPEETHLQSLPRGFASRSCFSKPPWLSSDFFKSRFLHPSTTLRRSTATGYKPNSYTTNHISAIMNSKNRDPRLSPRRPIRARPSIASA
jgi:hypothetical protein